MKHALIIEDNSLIARMISNYLRDSGYGSVEIAASQTEAIDHAKDAVPI